MHQRMNKYLMNLRMESKALENRGKPPLLSKDVRQTKEFVFTKSLDNDGDSGQLLLAKRKTDHSEPYLVKHEYTDCACNEFVYTKLAQAMDYSMPDAVLFYLSPGEKRTFFKTEYIIGERYLNVLDPSPSYEKVRGEAKNWKQYFAFFGLYALTNESDGVELVLADDGLIYRVDTTDAFPVSNYQLDCAGINQEIKGMNPHDLFKKDMLSRDMSQLFLPSVCDLILERGLKEDPDCKPYFLEPFARIQEISSEYIDGFLNTLCYFYPDFIGDYFKLYISALQEQCAEYLVGRAS